MWLVSCMMTNMHKCINALVTLGSCWALLGSGSGSGISKCSWISWMACHCSWLYVTPVSALINALPVVRIMLTVLTYTKWLMMNALAGWDFMVIFMVIFTWPTGGLFDGFGL